MNNLGTVRTVGIDLGKNIFQIHGSDASGKVVIRRSIKRASLLTFMANLPKCSVGIEACGGSHYWGREFRRIGHDVKIISPQFVKPFVKTNKNNAADAEATEEAMTRPSMRFVPVKAEWQQDALMVHRIRERLIRNKTALMNEMRGFLQEYGVVFSKGAIHLKNGVTELLGRVPQGRSELFLSMMQDLYSELLDVEVRIKRLDALIGKMYNESEVNRRIGEVPGIGPITATALTSTVGDAAYFKNGRQVAAWLGLVPRQNSTGDKATLRGISKRGDKYVRKLLVHGARSVLRHIGSKTDERSKTWIKKMERIGFNKACVALANRNARRCWALMANGERYKA